MAIYGTLEGFRAYALERGDRAPTDAQNDAATAALVRASDMIRYRYVANLAEGYDDTLHIVEPATYVAASLELATPSFFAKTFTAAEQKVLVGVKGIKWQVVGDAGGMFGAVPTSTVIEAMFAPYLRTLGPAILVV